MKIITDSTCDMSFAQANEAGIEMIPMKLYFGEEEYIDKVTITEQEFYKKLSECKTPPKTTLINSGQFLEAFEKYKDEDILVLTLSSKLSGTYDCAYTACEISGRKDIYVLDTKTVTMGLMLLVKEAVKMRDEGKSAKEIYDRLIVLREKVKIVAIIDTLKYLVLGGRISGFTGHIGTLLNIKPLICSENGGIITFDKARGRINALEKLKQAVFETYKMDTSKPFFYVYNTDITAIDDLKKIINQDAPAYIIGSVVGTHAGPGAIGLVYFTK